MMPPQGTVTPQTAVDLNERSIALRLVKVSLGLAAAVAAIAASALLGWALGNETLKSGIPGLITMKVTTAACLLLGAGGVVASARHRANWVRGLAIAMLLLATATLLEYALNIDLGIDNLLFVDRVSPRFPGRASPGTMLCCITFGISLLLLQSKRRQTLAHVLLIVSLLTPLASIGGYLFRAPGIMEHAPFPAVALNTSLALLFLAVGAMFTRPRGGMMRVVSSAQLAGAIARVMLPLSALLPLGVGLAVLHGRHRGWYGAEFSAALIIAVCCVAFLAASWWVSLLLLEKEQSLAELERHFSVTFEQAAVGIAHLDTQGRWLRVNQRLCEILGYTCEALLATSFDVIAQSTEEAAQVSAAREFFSGKRATLSLQKRHERAGRTIWISINGTLVKRDDDAPAYCIVVVEDISDHKAAEQANASLAAIVESSQDAIVSKRLDGTITTWNAGAERLFGYTAAEAIGQSITMLIPPDLLGEEAEIIARISRGERIEHYETVRRTREGRLIDVSLSVSPMADASGRIFGASKIARDIGEAKRQQRELVEAKRAAEAANAAKDQFLAVLSHELRTPLTPILGTVQLLEREADLVPDLRQAMQLIRRNVELEARLIDDLLDLTRITHGKIQLHHEAVDLHAVLRQAVDMGRSASEEKRLTVRQNLAAQRHTVWADPTRIQQVVWNLLSNAMKFTPDGGTITLATSNERGGDALAVEVSDSGVGIAPEALPRLFLAFEQGERTINRRFGGLGLGLAISRALVEMHQGTIEAHSAGVGKGARFIFRIPTMPPVEEAAVTVSPRVASPAPAPASPHPQRILLIEDNEDTLRVMARLLIRFGYVVETATTVKSAMHLATEQRFDLVVSDIGLPDGTGWDIMRELKARHRLRGIALSGFGMNEDINRSHEAGFEHHLVKPVDFNQLKLIVEKMTATAA